MLTHLPRFGDWVGGWVGLSVESCEITKKFIKLDLIEIIQFCLKIYDLCTNSPPMGECMGGQVGQWVGSCQISKNQINHHLIEIIDGSVGGFMLN